MNFQKLQNTITSFLSQRIVLLFLILVSLFLRIQYESTFVDMDNDKMAQLSSAKSFIANKGFSICSIDYYTNEVTGKFLTDFPPGYALTIIPIYKITHNFVTASIILDILAIIFLYIVLFKFLQFLQFSKLKKLFIFIFFGISYTPFFHLTSTDLLSLTVFQWALYLSLRFIEKPQKLVLQAVIIGVLLYFTAFFRYSYYPILFMIPGAIFIMGYLNKNKKQLQFSILSGITAAILLGIQIIVIKLQSGLMVRDLSNTGIFLKNLLQYDAFPLKSLFFYEGLDAAFKSNFLIYSIFTCATLLFSIFIIIEILRFYRKRIIQEQSVKNYMFINIVVLLGNVLFLSYMSFTQKPLDWQNPPWTYVEETRYYSQSILFFEIIIISGILSQLYSHKIKQYIYSIFLVTIFGYAFLYWTNNNYKLYVKKDNQYTFKGMNKELLQIKDMINSIENVNKYIVFSSPKDFMNSFMYVFSDISAISVHSQNIILDSAMYSKHPIKFYIAIPHDVSYLNGNEHAKKIAEFKTFDLYTREIQ